VSEDDNVADVGANAYPVAFGDFRRGYLIVDRIGVRVLRDPYTAKPYVEVLHDQARGRRRPELRGHQAPEDLDLALIRLRRGGG
jgi:hypothetical protein